MCTTSLGAGLTPRVTFHWCKYARLSNRRPSPFFRSKMTAEAGARQPGRTRRSSPGLRLKETSRMFRELVVSKASEGPPLYKYIPTNTQGGEKRKSPDIAFGS